MSRVPVALLGCTGLVGQSYVQMLANHPFFKIEALVSSKSFPSYAEAIHKKWSLPSPPPKESLSLPVYSLDAFTQSSPPPVVFSALPKRIAEAIDSLLAEQGAWVIAHSNHHRRNPQVPLIFPEINWHHLKRLKSPKESPGGVIAKPNCSIHSYLLACYALMQHVNLLSVEVSTMQSLSGAGREALALTEVAAEIPGEEEKSQWEPRKILSRTTKDLFEPIFTARCMRIPTHIGHWASTYIHMEKPLSLDEVIAIWQEFQPDQAIAELPSTQKSLVYLPKNQDLSTARLPGHGMSIFLGKASLPKENLLYVLGLSDNLLRGAAGSGLQIAELLYSQGYLSC